jgi:transforming growth factor-beta-induced protein
MIATLALLLAADPAAFQQPEPASILETARTTGQFQTLLAAAKAAGLEATLAGKGPFTVLAPTDDAFAKLPKGTLEMLLEKKNKPLLEAVLLNHVIAGSVLLSEVAKAAKAGFVATAGGQRLAIKSVKDVLSVGDAKLLAVDLQCSNGVIHVIDTVLVPELADVVDLAVKAGNFQTLATAIETAGLLEALKGAGPFTVFAPTDEAFAALPKGTVETLLMPENKEKLVAILKYHVVSGRQYANQVVGLKTLTTLQGGTLKVMVSEEGATIGGAKLLKTDLQARNGVIHVIDRVLLPQ